MNRTTLAVSLVLAAGCAQTTTPQTPAKTESSPAASAPASAPASAAAAAGPAMPSAPARGDDADRKSKNGVVEATLSGVPVRVQYGRPHVNGRTIFGDLIPFDQVWRTGADEATTISLAKDAKIAGQPVAAGTYALFTIPGKDGWKVILNSVAQQWGAYKIDRSKDVLVAEVTAAEHEPTEVLTMANEGDALVLTWATTAVTIPVAAP